MAVSPIAEALYLAHKQQATGRLRVLRGTRESQLYFDRGALVGAQLRFGHFPAAQALLLSGKLDLGAIDALWARGEAARLNDPDTLADLGLTEEEAATTHVLENVKNLKALAEGTAREC